MKINVFLELKKDYRTSFIKCSKELYNELNSTFILDDTNVPHVSVLQIKTKESFISELKDFINEYNSIYKLVFNSYCINYALNKKLYSTYNYIYIDIQANLTKELWDLHFKIMSIIKNKKDILNASGYLYRPHLTLGLIKISHELPPFKIYKEVLFTPFEFKLNIGEIDPDFQIKKIL